MHAPVHHRPEILCRIWGRITNFSTKRLCGASPFPPNRGKQLRNDLVAMDPRRGCRKTLILRWFVHSHESTDYRNRFRRDGFLWSLGRPTDPCRSGFSFSCLFCSPFGGPRADGSALQIENCKLKIANCQARGVVTQDIGNTRGVKDQWRSVGGRNSALKGKRDPGGG
jgi:hypothetical protein